MIGDRVYQKYNKLVILSWRDKNLDSPFKANQVYKSLQLHQSSFSIRVPISDQ